MEHSHIKDILYLFVKSFIFVYVSIYLTFYLSINIHLSIYLHLYLFCLLLIYLFIFQDFFSSVPFSVPVTTNFFPFLMKKPCLFGFFVFCFLSCLFSPPSYSNPINASTHPSCVDEVQGMGLRFRLYGVERMRRERMIGESIVGFASLNLDLETTHWVVLEPRSNLSVSASSFRSISTPLLILSFRHKG